MTVSARRSRRAVDIWPGFVDALANLLMVIIFVLLMFVLAQFFLTEALSGRDAALRRLESQVAELADLLVLERRTSADLQLNVQRLSAELQASIAARDELNIAIHRLTERAESAERQSQELTRTFSEAFGSASVDKATIEAKARELAKLARDIAALQALKEELERQAAGLASKAKESESALIEERKVSESARAQLALLNQQMAALKEQIQRLTAALGAAEQKAKEQQVEIASLGQRLNAALAGKVQELSRYRSEFFGRLREVLGNQPGIRIVGDRFVFQSEVLFDTGSAELEEAGAAQIGRVADTLKEISRRIPSDIDWILQVEGHTDRLPINTLLYPSNWELSTARAISVIQVLIENGISPQRLSAAGFGEFHPLDDHNDEIAYRRNRRIELKLTQR